jgi:hypothetical protein
MTPEASQTVPEKPRDRVSVEENDVPGERNCDWKPEEGVQELREFRSCRISEALLKGALEVTDGTQS